MINRILQMLLRYIINKLACRPRARLSFGTLGFNLSRCMPHNSPEVLAYIYIRKPQMNFKYIQFSEMMSADLSRAFKWSSHLCINIQNLYSTCFVASPTIKLE